MRKGSVSIETHQLASTNQLHDIIIRFEGVTKAFGPVIVLREIDPIYMVTDGRDQHVGSGTMIGVSSACSTIAQRRSNK